MADPQVLRDVLAADALLVTPEEAAALLRVGRTTVYALMKAGDLRSVHIGRSCRLPRAELERYVGKLTAPLMAPVSPPLEPSTDARDSLSSVPNRAPVH